MAGFTAGALWLLFAASSLLATLGAPSNAPTISLAPSSAPSEYTFNISDLTGVFNDLTEITGPLSSQDVLNSKIPFVGKSINEMIGGQASTTIATLLDFSGFVNFTKDRKNGVYVIFDRSAIAAELTDYLESYDTTADLLAGEGCSKNIEASYEEGETTMTLDFCVLFQLPRSSTLSGDGLFDSIPDIFEIDLDVSLDFLATLLFKAHLEIEFDGPGATATITVDPIIATLEANGNVAVTVGVGVLELKSDATAEVDASFELTTCDITVEPCIDIGERLSTSNFYLKRSASYSIAGTTTLGSTFPGLTLGSDAAFSVVEKNIFEPNPEVNIKGFVKEDFLNFSPENSVAMLRLIDSAIIRAQENEAFYTNIPLTDTSIADVLSTGSLVTTSLLKLFQKVEPYEDRPTKSLWLIQKDNKDAYTNDSIKNKTFELYYLAGKSIPNTELNVNPDNQKALRGLVSKEGVICPIKFDKDFTSSVAFKTEMLKLLQADCPALTFCDANQCKFDERNNDCDECKLVVGIGKEDLVFLASNADNDVHLIGFMEPLEFSQGEGSIYKFPVNTPAYPSLIPRFRSWEDFTDRIEQAISSSEHISEANVDFRYIEAIDQEKAAEYELSIGFSKTDSFPIALNASEGIGDLIDISVSEGSSLDLTVTATYTTKFGVIQQANDDEQLTVLAQACEGNGPVCDTSSLDIKLYYEDNNDPQPQWRNVTLPGGQNKRVAQVLSETFRGVADVTEKGVNNSLLVIRFLPTISEVKLLLLKVNK
jgi:hypothetical protein